MSRRPAFSRGVIVAAALAASAGLGAALLPPFLGAAFLVRLAIPLLSLAYLFHILSSSGARTGRVMALSAWALFAVLTAWLVESLPLYLLLHCGAIWMLRCLFAYASLVPAIIDMTLSAVAFLALAWAIARSGSIFLATWCFFLVQALWVFIPRDLQQQRKAGATVSNQLFEGARRRADAALRQLYNQ